MAMAATAMPGETTPPSPLPAPAPLFRYPSPAASISSGMVLWDTPVSGLVRGEPQDSGDFSGEEQGGSYVHGLKEVQNLVRLSLFLNLPTVLSCCRLHGVQICVT